MTTSPFCPLSPLSPPPLRLPASPQHPPSTFKLCVCVFLSDSRRLFLFFGPRTCHVAKIINSRCLPLPPASVAAPARCLSISVWPYCRARPAWLLGLPFPCRLCRLLPASRLRFMPPPSDSFIVCNRCSNKNSRGQWGRGRGHHLLSGGLGAVQAHVSLSSLTLCQVEDIIENKFIKQASFSSQSVSLPLPLSF